MGLDLLSPIAEWLLLNFFAALLPLFLNWVLFAVLRINTRWSSLVKNGEMFFYSVTISAYSLAKIILDSSYYSKPNYQITVIVLIFILIASSLIFGGLGMIAIISASHPKSIIKNLVKTDDNWFAFGSTGFAISSAIMSYIATSR